MLHIIFDQFWIRYLPAVSAIFTDRLSFSTLASDIFPLVSKCNYELIGPSGTLETRDAKCLLTLNIVNEKIFAFLYIWYIALLFVSGCNLILRSITIMSSTIRMKMIQSQSTWTVPLPRKRVHKILHGDNVGDWFIIFLLGKNLNCFAFREVLNELSNGGSKSINDV